MIIPVVLGLVAVLIGWIAARAIRARHGTNRTPGRMRHAMRYRLRRVRLPRDWWEQFEHDFAAYVDPHSARARNRERG